MPLDVAVPSALRLICLLRCRARSALRALYDMHPPPLALMMLRRVLLQR